MPGEQSLTESRAIYRWLVELLEREAALALTEAQTATSGYRNRFTGVS
jgi:hypothetical protein